MKESVLYDRLRPQVLKWGGAVTRVENILVGALPDIHYCLDQRMGWIETKLEKSGLLYFEKFQIPWATTQVKAGARHLFVLSGVNNDTVMKLYDYGDMTSAPKELKGKWQVIRAADLDPLLELDKPYDWDMLRSLLTR